MELVLSDHLSFDPSQRRGNRAGWTSPLARVKRVIVFSGIFPTKPVGAVCASILPPGIR